MREGTKKSRKGLIITLSVLGVLAIAAVLWFTVFWNVVKYNGAKANLEAGNFEAAITSFEKLQNYSDAPDMVLESKYQYAKSLTESKSFEEALALYDEIPDYRDVPECRKECIYQQALWLFEEEEEYSQGYDLCKELGDYKDCPELLLEYAYEAGEENYKDGNFNAAKEQFLLVKDQDGAAEYLENLDILIPYQGTWKEPKRNAGGTKDKIVFDGWNVTVILGPYNGRGKVPFCSTTKYIIQELGFTYVLRDGNLVKISVTDRDLERVYERYSDSTDHLELLPEPEKGMTKGEILCCSWGEPEKKIPNFSDGPFEVWVYSEGRSIAFDQGIAFYIMT